ncbi:MAG: response regulator [Candidatus Omnitrophica bacterium]|nr:response regulator [Candidatus Omnitrophota bacterium]
MNKTKILIVDDEEDILKLLSMYLTRKNYYCLTAKNQAEAMELIEKEHPEIVLLDIFLGNESGIDILCKIKKMHSDIKVIMLTVMQDETNIIKAKSCGADDYVLKFSEGSFMSEEVLRRISHFSAKQ